MQIRTYVGIASLALMVIGPALAHFELVPALAGFGVFLLAALLGLVVTIWGLVAAIKQGSPAAYLPSLLGLPALALVIVGAAGARGHPRINDISTDLQNPPALSRAPAYPESFKSVVAKHYDDLAALELPEPPARVFERARKLAESRDNWSVSRADAEALIVEGTAKTRLFRFIDDWIVRIRPGKTGGSIVDMRSRSRDGKGDLGKNAARIRAFFADLRTRN